jgi:hypothetical protein
VLRDAVGQQNTLDRDVLQLIVERELPSRVGIEQRREQYLPSL